MNVLVSQTSQIMQNLNEIQEGLSSIKNMLSHSGSVAVTRLSSVLQDTVAFLDTHVNAFSEDIQGIVRDTIQTATAALCILYSALFVVMFSALFLISLMWDTNRNTAFIIVIGTFLLMLLLSIIAISKALSRLKKSFSTTMRQLEKDRRDFNAYHNFY